MPCVSILAVSHFGVSDARDALASGPRRENRSHLSGGKDENLWGALNIRKAVQVTDQNKKVSCVDQLRRHRPVRFVLQPLRVDTDLSSIGVSNEQVHFLGISKRERNDVAQSV